MEKKFIVEFYHCGGGAMSYVVMADTFPAALLVALMLLRNDDLDPANFTKTIVEEV